MSINFSFLDCDKKSYEYSIRILNHVLEDNTKSLLSLENEIQQEEILQHFKLNNIINKKEQNLEAIRWIKQNGDPFRKYLNSLKIVVLIFLHKKLYCKKSCDRNCLSFEIFKEVVSEIDSYRELIENIF